MNVNPLEMIAGIVVGFFIAFVFLNLFFGRTMTVVLGQRFKTQAGFFKAIVLLCRDYWGGYSNTLFVRDGAIGPDVMTVEYGIGYNGTFSQYRVFESYAHMHKVWGAQGGFDPDGKFYDAVIPNYLNPDDYPFQEKKDDYFLYLGRLIKRKDIDVAVETCKRIAVCGRRRLKLGPKTGRRITTAMSLATCSSVPAGAALGTSKVSSRWKRTVMSAHRRRSWQYVAGVMSVFLTLGVAATGPGFVWGGKFDHAWFTWGTAVVCFLLGLFYLDVYPWPSIGFREAESDFGKDVLTTLLPSACSGPFLGAVFAASLVEPAWKVITLFLTIRAGLRMSYPRRGFQSLTIEYTERVKSIWTLLPEGKF